MTRYEKVSQKKLLRIWEDITNCQVLIGKNCYNLATGSGSSSIYVYKRDINLPVKPGDSVVIKIIHDTIYIFKTIVRSIERSIMTYYRLELPEEGIRIQRRDDFRLSVELPARYKEDGKFPKKGIVRDVSAGGLGISHEEPMDIGNKIIVELNLDGNLLVLGGVVRRSYKTPSSYLTGIEFNNVKSQDKEIIVKYIFDETRRRRQNRYK